MKIGTEMNEIEMKEIFRGTMKLRAIVYYKGKIIKCLSKMTK
jgi:hypothetical protein